MLELAVDMVELLGASEEMLLAELAGVLSPPPQALSKLASITTLGNPMGCNDESRRTFEEKSGRLLFILCSISCWLGGSQLAALVTAGV